MQFAQRAFSKYGLGDKWGYYDAHLATWLGPCSENIKDIYESADMFVNVSGVDKIRPWFESIPVHVIIDTEPLFTQIRNLTDISWKEEPARYTAHLSYGENISRVTPFVLVDHTALDIVQMGAHIHTKRSLLEWNVRKRFGGD